MSDTPASTALIARQAIMNAQHEVVGYELFNRSRAPESGHTAASDVILVFTALSHAGADDLVGQKLLFVNCTHESLAGGHLELINPGKVVLEIPPLPHAGADEAAARVPILAALRGRGFRLAFSHHALEAAYAAWLPLADFIKLDLSVLPPGQAAALARHAQRHTQARLVAEKVETAEQHMHIANCGVQLFQGYWFARPALVEARLLAPGQASIVQLINLVRQQASTDAIEEVLKKDAGLAFNLMRLINSAGFGLQREITSFKQAVMLLGLKKLFRWAALLLTVSRQGGVPPAAGQTAVVRARLMELLALETMSQDEADLAFVAGIFSLLGAMLGLPQEQALNLVSMPEPMATAVLRHDGPLGALLTLAEACEASDDTLFDRAAATLHLTSQQINLAHLQALAWSDQVAGS